jgi:orotidine-5'-phosphate decarboxylase
MTTASYGSRLQAAVARHGRLCVGIDPHPAILDGWQLPHTADGLERCARTMVEAVAGRVVVVKPQSAFFEAYGSAGIAVLERVLADSRDAGLLTLLDVKRGDIGSTMAAYARAYLSDDSPLAADAVTLSPYLGATSVEAAVDQATRTGRGVYLLAVTSNPEASAIQQATGQDGETISQMVVAEAKAYNGRTTAAELAPSGHSTNAGDQRWGSVGVVVGATISPAITDDLGLDDFTGSILAPGFGAQGGSAADLRGLFRSCYDHVIPTSSRAIMGAGPRLDNLRSAVADAQANLG